MLVKNELVLMPDEPCQMTTVRRRLRGKQPVVIKLDGLVKAESENKVIKQRQRGVRKSKGKIWKIETANAMGYHGARLAVQSSRADVLLIQETSLWHEQARTSAERWCLTAGWAAKMALALPPSNLAGKGSAGVAAMARRNVFGTGFWPGFASTSGVIVPNRVLGLWSNFACKGGLRIASVYLQVGIKLRYRHCRTENANWCSLMRLLAAIKTSASPWIAGGDWNLTPKELADSGWLELVKGVVVQPGRPTCFTKGAPSCIDYFVVDRRIADKTRAVVKSGGLIKTHRPVILEIRGALRETMVVRQVKPAKFDLDLPHGPRQAPPDETTVACKDALSKLTNLDNLDTDAAQTVLDEVTAAWYEAAEKELVVHCDLDPAKCEAHLGRAKGPVFKKFAVAGLPGHPRPIGSKLSNAMRRAGETLLDACRASKEKAWWRKIFGKKLEREIRLLEKVEAPEWVTEAVRDFASKRVAEREAAAEAVREAALLEEKVARDEAMIGWHRWAVQAVDTRGAAAAHKFTKQSAVEPFETKRMTNETFYIALEQEIATWDKLWKSTRPYKKPAWPPIVQLKPFTEDDVREAAMTFRSGMGLGPDVFNPRWIGALSGAVVKLLLAILLCVEQVGIAPMIALNLEVPLLPKRDGG